ncbi:MAG: molecular chaperone DnaK [Candidatus Omnitrophica bacterium]|nr:molecular chaperone DnaK [Candidatus Omnitrophota bacterium]MCA9423646.1 molecular chaperone DnaK [Candidatus Omnitrophota bacterium]MCA9440860.1 molecular chaperone DnaK [Candidatus Omnitrophota bacterium]MCB9769971.1 molecular chaperone DnaK [Candidatus Omnitrophota bacterium]
MASRIVGIDLGTTNSCGAIIENGEAVIIPNSLGDRITPSVVCIDEEGDVLVGKPAKRAAALNPDRTVFSIKRHMGTNFRVNIDSKQYTPQEISAMILQKIKWDMEEYFGEEIDQAVITVPAYFTDAQRQATRDAGEIAGLNVRRIIDEPTAAAIAYGIDKEEDQILMVYDFGGGTFDISIIEVIGGVFQVLAIKGNNMLGGDDFDQRIVDWLVGDFKEEHGIDLSEEKGTLYKLKAAAEQAKIELSQAQKTNILLEAIAMSDSGPLTLDVTLTRSKLENLIEDLVESTVPLCRQAIEDAGLTPNDISSVIMVGGSTRIPMVQEAVKKVVETGARKDVNPDEVVAMGAAYQSELLASLDAELEMSAGARMPEDNPVIVHLTPFSLGVGLVGDQFGVLIERNSTYPTEAKDYFTTTRDFQTAISFPIYEGEEQVASTNTFLDMLRIDGLPPAPRGIPRIEVTFRLNHDRILEATAKDLTTGNEVTVTVVATDNRLSDQEKSRMTREARNRITKMLEQRVKETLYNQAESLIFRAEKMIGDSDDETAVETRGIIDTLQRALDGGDADQINGQMERLSDQITKLEAAEY